MSKPKIYIFTSDCFMKEATVLKDTVFIVVPNHQYHIINHDKYGEIKIDNSHLDNLLKSGTIIDYPEPKNQDKPYSIETLARERDEAKEEIQRLCTEIVERGKELEESNAFKQILWRSVLANRKEVKDLKDSITELEQQHDLEPCKKSTGVNLTGLRLEKSDAHLANFLNTGKQITDYLNAGEKSRTQGSGFKTSPGTTGYHEPVKCVPDEPEKVTVSPAKHWKSKFDEICDRHGDLLIANKSLGDELTASRKENKYDKVKIENLKFLRSNDEFMRQCEEYTDNLNRENDQPKTVAAKEPDTRTLNQLIMLATGVSVGALLISLIALATASNQ